MVSDEQTETPEPVEPERIEAQPASTARNAYPFGFTNFLNVDPAPSTVINMARQGRVIE